jgi:2-iminobutanoate/2-iminopropanoate deaminase
MFKKVHVSNEAPAPIGPYSQAIEVNNMVFCSGQIPLDAKTGEVLKGTASEQAEKVMQNIQAVLKSAGLTFANVIKTTIYLTDMKDFAAVNEVYAIYFQDAPPARSTVAVAGLPRGVNVEIEVLAMRL